MVRSIAGKRGGSEGSRTSSQTADISRLISERVLGHNSPRTVKADHCFEPLGHGRSSGAQQVRKIDPRPEAINSDKLPPREHPGSYNHRASGRRKYFRPHPNPILHRQLISSHSRARRRDDLIVANDATHHTKLPSFELVTESFGPILVP